MFFMLFLFDLLYCKCQTNGVKAIINLALNISKKLALGF